MTHHWARLAAALVATTALASGCSGDDAGPLEVSGFGNILHGDARPAYFTFFTCVDGDEPRDVTIMKVAPISVQGTRAPFTFKMAWSDGPDFVPAISSHTALPKAYVDAEGAEGEVGRCGESEEYAALAIVFPPVRNRPIVVDGIEVTYEVDGDEHTTTVDAFVAQCPVGHISDSTDEEDYTSLCRRRSSS